MRVWEPLPGPQTEALESEADIVLYGGAAGGGKTDLAIGLALTKHRRSIIYRREGTQLQGILDRMSDILGSWDGYSGQYRLWRRGNQQIEFGSCPHPGDERKYQGRPHDLIVFDEAVHFTEHQVRFLMGWLRTTLPYQRCRVVFTSNPPTGADEQEEDPDWLIRYFAPWLDNNHPRPAKPGELRWYAIVDGEEREVASGESFTHGGETIKPRSRTFIPARVQDNPYLMGTEYESQLQALPEPLRSQMLQGDFTAHMGDNPWQVIPSGWIQAAQDRWEKGKHGKMDSMGVDPARGGKDETVIARRHGTWFDELIAYPGAQTPDGPTVSAIVFAQARDGASIHVEVTGIGSSVYDHMQANSKSVVAFSPADKSEAMDESGALRFANKRAELWWRMREALDPKNGHEIALPPDPMLRADLTAPRWKLLAQGVQVESKDDIKRRLGRSPDRGDAVVMANMAHVPIELNMPPVGSGGGWMAN